MSDRFRLLGDLDPGLTARAPGGPRVLAYSHDGYGLGHLRRNLRLVNGLRRQRPDVDAMLVTGAKSAARLVQGSEVSCIPLPAVTKVGNGRYVAEDGERSFDEVIRARAKTIAGAVAVFQPDLLLVDRYPRGMHDEVLPALLEHTARRPAVLGLRDILDSPSVIREEWRSQRYSEAILEHYAAVLCYGDPAVYDPIREYGLASEVAERVHFTGYLADELLVGDAAEVRRRHRFPGGRLAVCTLGGGRDAAHIALAFLGAMERMSSSGWTGVLITGPYMSSDDLERLFAHSAADLVSILPMVDDVPSYLAAADAAVCMGGYNTTCELLALAVPAVIIPRVQPRQEQLMRVERLGARGLVWWLHPSDLSDGFLADRIERASARPRAELAQRLGTIARRGIDTAAQHLAALLPTAAPMAAPDRQPLAAREPPEQFGAIS